MSLIEPFFTPNNTKDEQNEVLTSPTTTPQPMDSHSQLQPQTEFKLTQNPYNNTNTIYFTIWHPIVS